MLVACWNFLIGRVLRRVFVQKFVQKNVSGSFFPPETFYDSCRVFKGCEPLWDDDFLLVHDHNVLIIIYHLSLAQRFHYSLFTIH